MIGSPLLIAERARARLRSVVDSMQSGRAPESNGQVDVTSLPPESDIVTTAAEINEFHGTGTLLFRIFPDASSIISLRTSNFYDGNQTFGAASYCLPLSCASRAEVYSWVRWYLSGTHVRRILTIPYLPADPLVSLAVKDQSNAPLCTYIMDDKNVCDDGISDELMEELLTKSDLRTGDAGSIRKEISHEVLGDAAPGPGVAVESRDASVARWSRSQARSAAGEHMGTKMARYAARNVS
jgi:hypothetical protein